MRWSPLIAAVVFAPALAEAKPSPECVAYAAGVDDTAIAAADEAGGRHWRIPTPNGPVHVWRPDGHSPITGGLVIYAHGYYTDIDTAWCEHRLAAQFAASKRDALFIAPALPGRTGVDPPLPDLGAVVRIARRAGVVRPYGPLVVIGHSGAYRTIAGWLRYRDVDHVILLDGLYGRESIYLGWLDGRAPRPRRLTIVANDTLRWTEPALVGRTDLRSLDQIPARLGPADAAARLLYIKSQLGHMAIVESGRVIPKLLAISGVAAGAR